MKKENYQYVIGAIVLLLIGFFLGSWGSGLYGATSTHYIGQNLTIAGTLGVTGATTLGTANITTGNVTTDNISTGNITTANITTDNVTTLDVSGTSTFSGYVLGVPRAMDITMTSTSATPCAVQNNTGYTKRITDIGAIYTSTTAAGPFRVDVGTSSNLGVTSTSPLIDTLITTIAGRDVITTTSTALNATSSANTWTPEVAPWRNGEWLVWKAVTTTNRGYCTVVYY